MHSGYHSVYHAESLIWIRPTKIILDSCGNHSRLPTQRDTKYQYGGEHTSRTAFELKVVGRSSASVWVLGACSRPSRAAEKKLIIGQSSAVLLVIFQDQRVGSFGILQQVTLSSQRMRCGLMIITGLILYHVYKQNQFLICRPISTNF